MYERVVRSRAEWTAGYCRVLEARSHQTSTARLRTLACDEIRPVRLYVARNPTAPADALARLMTDEDSSVAWNALHNPSTPAEALAMAAAEEERQAGSRWFTDRHLVARHPNTPVALRDELLKAGACNCPGTCFTKLAFARHS